MLRNVGSHNNIIGYYHVSGYSDRFHKDHFLIKTGSTVIAGEEVDFMHTRSILNRRLNRISGYYVDLMLIYHKFYGWIKDNL